MHFVQEIRARLRTPRRALRQAGHRIQDAKFNIRTRVPGGQRFIEGCPGEIEYEPINYPALRAIQQRAPVACDDVVFELGCGMGAAVCFYASLPVQAVIGVEMSEGLAAIAADNVKKMVGRKSPASIICGNAANEDYARATFVFMYNPFGADVMRSVLSQLVGNTHVKIVYVSPVQKGVFSEFPAIKPVDSFHVPYESTRMETTIWQIG